MVNLRRLWENYSLSLVLFGLFLSTWILQTYTGWMEFSAEQHTHGEDSAVFGSSSYFWVWALATMENWQSEFLFEQIEKKLAKMS